MNRGSGIDCLSTSTVLTRTGLYTCMQRADRHDVCRRRAEIHLTGRCDSLCSRRSRSVVTPLATRDSMILWLRVVQGSIHGGSKGRGPLDPWKTFMTLPRPNLHHRCTFDFPMYFFLSELNQVGAFIGQPHSHLLIRFCKKRRKSSHRRRTTARLRRRSGSIQAHAAVWIYWTDSNLIF